MGAPLMRTLRNFSPARPLPVSMGSVKTTRMQAASIGLWNICVRFRRRVQRNVATALAHPGARLPLLALAIAGSFHKPAHAAAPIPDPRHLGNRWPIPGEGYPDQPYVVQMEDDDWVCILTTGRGLEGAGGQHVVSMRSTDHGRSWSPERSRCR